MADITVHTIADEIAAYFIAETKHVDVEHQPMVSVVRMVLPDGRRFIVHVEEGYPERGRRRADEENQGR